MTHPDQALRDSEPRTTVAPRLNDRVTVYTSGNMGMGWTGRVLKWCKVELVQRYGRTDCEVTGRVLRKRSDSRLVVYGEQGRPEIVIVRGQHPERPISVYDAATEQTSNGVTVNRGRYPSCDPRWNSDFDEWLEDRDVVYDARREAKA